MNTFIPLLGVLLAECGESVDHLFQHHGVTAQLWFCLMECGFTDLHECFIELVFHLSLFSLMAFKEVDRKFKMRDDGLFWVVWIVRVNSLGK